MSGNSNMALQRAIGFRTPVVPLSPISAMGHAGPRKSKRHTDHLEQPVHRRLASGIRRQREMLRKSMTSFAKLAAQVGAPCCVRPGIDPAGLDLIRL